MQPQLLFYKNRCVGCGRCKQVCPYSLEKCDFCGKCEKACPSGARKICGREYAVEELVETAGGIVCGRCAILAEGDAIDREDIFYLEPLPLFFAE